MLNRKNLSRLLYPVRQSPIFRRIRDSLIMNYQRLRQPTFITIKGIKISLGEHISEEIRDQLYLGYYESSEIHVTKHWLDPDDVVMEIGAGIGFISSYCAKTIGSNRVFAYEANPELENHIRENYKLNGINPTLESCLIGDQNGEKIFYLEKAFWGSSTHPWTSEAKPVKVPMKSFEQEVKRLNPTFLIVDIEGGEYELFKVANLHNIKKICVELHPENIGREKTEFIKDRLSQAGFRVNEEFSSQGGGLEQLFLQRF